MRETFACLAMSPQLSLTSVEGECGSSPIFTCGHSVTLEDKDNRQNRKDSDPFEADQASCTTDREANLVRVLPWGCLLADVDFV